jgi:hypothetical protein
MLTFRKTRENKWAAFGPVAELKVGAVDVHKADGTDKTVQVKSISRPFNADGVMCAFGFLEEAAPKKPASSLGQNRPRGFGGRYECPECGDYVYPGTSCWETGCTH